MKDLHCNEIASLRVLVFNLQPLTAPVNGKRKPVRMKIHAVLIRGTGPGEISYSERCPVICEGCSYYYGVNVKFWDAFIRTHFIAPALDCLDWPS